MAWSMNLYGMPSIRSFKQAQEYWAGAEGWRNKPASWRPLQTKRKDHVRLNKLHGEVGYECVLYNTPMVTYYADGEIRLIGHDSASSHSFAWHTAPAGITPVTNNGRMYWQVDTPEGTRFYRDSPLLELAPAPNGRWQLLNEPAKETEKVLDPKKAAAVRKLLSHYDKWEKLTSRLVGSDFRICPKYPPREDIQALLTSPQNPEMFARLRSAIGPVPGFREIAYELMGAYDEVAVAHDRLPRKKK